MQASTPKQILEQVTQLVQGSVRKNCDTLFKIVGGAEWDKGLQIAG